ncbi:MAG TPA: MFS transporter [Bryobacteraceae bacterium]|nr:MFS transporter [Bryobacteraceae bacterium]
MGTAAVDRQFCPARRKRWTETCMPGRKDSASVARANRALDAANFFLADVRDGLGPYLAIYLLTEQRWDEARIGLVMSIATVAGIVAQTPAGALIDATRAKRLVMVIAATIVTAASLLLPLYPNFLGAAFSQGSAHAAAAVFPPAIAAISLGVVGQRAFTARIGRNESFNHAGNAAAAAIAGAAACRFGPQVVFCLLALMALGSLVSVLAIPERAIDHDLARGLHAADDKALSGREQPSGLSVLLTWRPLLIFAICHRVAGGSCLPPAPTERGVRLYRTTLFGSWFTALQVPAASRKGGAV